MYLLYSSCTAADFIYNYVFVVSYRGSLGQGYDSNVAFWNFLAVGNYAGRFYKWSMQEVKATQDRIHAQLVQSVDAKEKEVMALITAAKDESAVSSQIVQQFTEFTQSQVEFIMAEWRDLLPRLISL